MKDNQGWFYGNQADVYVMASPNVVTRKITSIANSRNDNFNWIEAGWRQLPTGGPVHKVWYCVNGQPYSREMGNATPGSNYNYRIRYYGDSFPGSYIWRIDINLSQKEEQVIAFRVGRPKAGGERDNDGVGSNYTTNYVHMWNLRERDYDQNDNVVWHAWMDLIKTTDTDPRYSVTPYGDDYFYVQDNGR